MSRQTIIIDTKIKDILERYSKYQSIPINYLLKKCYGLLLFPKENLKK